MEELGEHKKEDEDEFIKILIYFAVENKELFNQYLRKKGYIDNYNKNMKARRYINKYI